MKEKVRNDWENYKWTVNENSFSNNKFNFL